MIEIFVITVATLIGRKIEIYSTTGVVGAAIAVGVIDGNFEKFGNDITKNDHERSLSFLIKKKTMKKHTIDEDRS